MLEFRLYKYGDFDACVDLIRSGHDANFSDQRFRWLHEQGPGGESAIALATDKGVVVGIYSVIRKRMRAAGKLYIGGRDVDPVVHPAYRGKRLFTRLLEFGLDGFTGIDFFFNFANAASAPGFRKGGWQDLYAPKDMVRQLGYSKIVSREFGLWLIGRAIPAPRSSAAVKELHSHEVRAILPADNLASNKARGRIQVERGSNYLVWRYLNSPLHQYRYFVSGGPAAWALAVVRLIESSNRLLVLDLLDLGRSPVLGEFLPTWASLFPTATVATWSAVPAELRRGWFANPMGQAKRQPILVRESPYGKTPRNLLQPENWMITHGDLEVM